jgi:DNA-directed RNA polymerase II subunit RPB2
MNYDKMSSFNKEDIWILIESYFKKQHLERLVRHQLESYNNFVDNEINNTINMFNPVTIHSENDYDPNLNKYALELFITFENLTIFRPQIHENNGAAKLMFPQEARLRNFTYSSQMVIDLNIKIVERYGDNLEKENIHYKKMNQIHIGKLPIMLKSNICVLTQNNHLNTNITGECKHDTGGYFIISGSEKTVLAQERAAENIVYCFNVKKTNTKWSWLAEIKSVPDWKCISPKQINMTIKTKNNGYGHPIYVNIPRIKNPVPLFTLFRALGIETDKEICEYILLNINDEKRKRLLFGLKASIVESQHFTEYEDCINFIVGSAMYTPINMTKEMGQKKKREFTINVLENDLFPHCKTKKQKIYFLGYMTNKLLQTSYGWRKCDDRDSYCNKRLDLTGTLLNNLFRNYFNKLVKDMQKQIIKEINNGSWRSTNNNMNIINKTNIYKIVKSTTIENGLKRALATGDFAIKNTNSNSKNKVGVAQVLNRLTYVASLSHLRRVNTPIDKSGKLIPPRKVHNTIWGMLCPSESPEGQSVGVVKNISYLTHITIKSSSSIIYDVLKDKVIPIDDMKPNELFGMVKIIVNGNWIGTSKEPYELYLDLKNKKYMGILNIYTSILFDFKNKELIICNEAGRPMRPIFKVKNNQILYTGEIASKIKNNEVSWDDLFTNHILDESILEYIDPAEQNSTMISMDNAKINGEINYTHAEIHPSSILGICANCIPFPNHNQSPRVTYQCAQGKQALGAYTTNFNHRMDKTSYVLSYMMRPLVDTRLMSYLNLHKIPSGEMLMVAIMSYSGFNQEDSIIFNKDALDRGMMCATLYHTEKDEDKQVHGDEEIRCKPIPNKTKGMKFANYDKLNSQGVVPENTLLENRDIIYGKVLPIREHKNDPTKVIKYKDLSRSYRTHEETYIDKNYINRNGDGYTFAKIRTRTFRKPVIGDKFASRHGQKGTIGVVLPASDMPFTKDGIRPDIIINPHAIPSRMTIGQLKETLLGKVLLQLGLFGDGTSFSDLPLSEIGDVLEKSGYERNGNEVLTNGMTGEQLETSIFFGPCFYQRLKHMVNDKMHARSIGPMVRLTHQPAEGRSRDGGLRFGEMERDCMISHGATRFIQDRTYYASDKFSVPVCNKCGMIAVYNNKKHIHICNTCNNRSDFSICNIPYACKLLFHELMTMNIVPRMITDKNIND